MMRVSPAVFYHATMRPALLHAESYALVDSRVALALFRSPDADAMLLAIALQETGLRYRVQVDAYGRPIERLARSWWQFEIRGVEGVLRHGSTGWLRTMLSLLAVGADPGNVHAQMAEVDTIATLMARALLWTLPDALPDATEQHEEEAWRQYLSGWRPGRPRRESWAQHWAMACAVVRPLYGLPPAAVDPATPVA